MIKVGSLFSGIGGFELGFKAVFKHHCKTVWQVEKEPFCQKILKQHFPESVIYDDVLTVGLHNLEPVDVIMGGFPCQSISLAGKMEGLQNEKKSGLWWEMFRIISELRPRIVLLENVANVIRLGGTDVVGSLAQIGYSCEWTIVRASDFGAPHRRARWFCVAYTDSAFVKRGGMSIRTQQEQPNINGDSRGQSLWSYSNLPKPTICGMDDGIPRKLDSSTNKIRKERLKALGNAIVPQCAEWVALQLFKSGLLDDLMENEHLSN